MIQKHSGALLLCLVCLTSGCSTPSSMTATESLLTDQAASAYRIGPEDVLMISVWQNQDISRTVPVRPDGMISLPLLNDVQAAGRTPEQLREVLRQRLQAYISQPEVSVIVTQVHSPKISVLGNVSRPARYVISGQTTVLDAIALAGGLTEFASRKRIMILRPDGSTRQHVPFNYDEAVRTQGNRQNVYLQPGDIVLVQ